MKRDNKQGMKWDFCWYNMPCPGCGKRWIDFSEDIKIEVNCEGEQEIEIEGMLSPINRCTNPFCEWSKLKEED